MTNLDHYGSTEHHSCNGHPGSLMTQVKYTWTDENHLHVEISAVGVRPNPVNITSQCLFNLAGHVGFLVVTRANEFCLFLFFPLLQQSKFMYF